MVAEREEFNNEGKPIQWRYCEGMEVITWRNDVFTYTFLLASCHVLSIHMLSVELCFLWKTFLVHLFSLDECFACTSACASCANLAPAGGVILLWRVVNNYVGTQNRIWVPCKNKYCWAIPSVPRFVCFIVLMVRFNINTVVFLLWNNLGPRNYHGNYSVFFRNHALKFKSTCCSSRWPEFGCQHPHLVTHNCLLLQFQELRHSLLVSPDIYAAYICTDAYT